ncbi:hypothetical protein TNIN_475451 [Trichonephila inaurata madagascariensis]|uniref:Uncharacterized protein n=1 Tax=Trichonephila inaurata madagascariensis TaxID=2747483 RepID=A0A8X6X770_9ARAC|nr:hypothetical protein TNIN_475451 [Trichonephila inaurata madagascariensis]
MHSISLQVMQGGGSRFLLAFVFLHISFIYCCVRRIMDEKCVYISNCNKIRKIGQTLYEISYKDFPCILKYIACLTHSIKLFYWSADLRF